MEKADSNKARLGGKLGGCHDIPPPMYLAGVFGKNDNLESTHLQGVRGEIYQRVPPTLHQIQMKKRTVRLANLHSHQYLQDGEGCHLTRTSTFHGTQLYHQIGTPTIHGTQLCHQWW
jgi:hypothetical protein